MSLPDANWAGCYFRCGGGELVLGPCQDKPACTRIAVDRGVCGTAAARAVCIGLLRRDRPLGPAVGPARTGGGGGALGLHSEAFAFAGAVYFALCFVGSRYSLWLERRLGGKRRLTRLA